MREYRAAVLTKPRHLVIETRTLRRLKPNEVLIRVAYAGICGTDLALHSGGYRVPLPLVLGHEFSGIVEQVGSDDCSHLVGRRVTAEINNTCISCEFLRPCPACRRGLDHHCSRRTVTGIMKHDGAFAEYVIVPRRNLHMLPPSVTLEGAVFIEPLAAALQTFRLTPICKGDSVVVLGAGRLGLLIGMVARSTGARVLMITRSRERCARARNPRTSLSLRPASKRHHWIRKKMGGKTWRRYRCRSNRLARYDVCSVADRAPARRHRAQKHARGHDATTRHDKNSCG
jgi:threonine dehydrogenase-like Zn-dependent dehydrogenase